MCSEVFGIMLGRSEEWVVRSFREFLLRQFTPQRTGSIKSCYLHFPLESSHFFRPYSSLCASRTARLRKHHITLFIRTSCLLRDLQIPTQILRCCMAMPLTSLLPPRYVCRVTSLPPTTFTISLCMSSFHLQAPPPSSPAIQFHRHHHNIMAAFPTVSMPRPLDLENEH